MQRVIDISEEMLEWVNDVNKFYIEYGIGDFIDVIKNGTPIPGNATNGDVIKALFPNEHDFETDFDEDWWNAPYQKGGK